MRCEQPRGTVVSQWREPSGTYHLPFESFELCHVAIQLSRSTAALFIGRLKQKAKAYAFSSSLIILNALLNPLSPKGREVTR